jgi:hypothetical protein
MLVSRLPAESVGPAKGAELICLRTYPNDAEAVIAKSVLEAAGIDSILRGADQPFIRGTDLFVSSEDAEAALVILFRRSGSTPKGSTDEWSVSRRSEFRSTRPDFSIYGFADT